jgi:hypothetical protein
MSASEEPILLRRDVIAQRLKVLEMEAAMERAALAATLDEWQQRRTMTWVMEAAKMAGGVLKTPTARWVLTALLMRIIRGRG